jgi:hypothetical protein
MWFIRYKTCLALDDVPMKRVYDDAFWAFLFKLVVYQAKQNTAEKIYDYLLPYGHTHLKPLHSSKQLSES